MEHNRLRWGLPAAASLFVLLVEWLQSQSHGMAGLIIWHAVLVGGVFLFTSEMLRRLGVLRERLVEESGRFRAVFEAAGLGVVLVGPDCMVTSINGSAESLSGSRREEVVGRLACSELLNCPGAARHGCADLCDRDAAAGPTESALRSAFLNHRSGRQIPVMVSAAALPGNGGHALLLWDATERVNLKAESALRKRQVDGLMEIGRVIAAYPDVRRNMDQILDRARELFGMDLAAWGLMHDTVPGIAWQAARGAGSAAVCGAVQSLEGLIMGGVLQSGRPFLTHNLAGQGTLFNAPPLQSAMAVPIRVAENVMGILLCASTQQLNLTDVDVMFFSHLASYTATAVENAELMEQVQHIAALEERQRLAREMHDGFGQLLTFLGLRHHMLARYAEAGDTAAILAELARLNQAVQEAHGEVRHNIFRLKESGQPKATMQERWRQILIDYAERTGIRAEYEVGDGVPSRLPEQTQVQLTRIVQEALTNVRNHSGALSVAVRLSMSEEGALSVQITDDGCGFEPPRVDGAAGHHFGLGIMRERAEAIGARLEIRSMRGNGTTVSVRLPAGKEGAHGDSSASGR